MPTIILQVYSGGCDGDCTHAVVAVDPQLAQRVVRRIGIARTQKEHDLNFVELVFWDGSPIFLRWAEELEEVLEQSGDSETGRLMPRASDGSTAGWRLLVDDDAPAEQLIERVECVQMVVTYEEILWRAIVKHTSIRLETEPLPLRFFQEVAIARAGSAASQPVHHGS